MSADEFAGLRQGYEAWQRQSAAQRAEIQRLEALVVTRTEQRDEARAHTKQMSELRAEAIDAVRRVARARDLVQAELDSARIELDGWFRMVRNITQALGADPDDPLTNLHEVIRKLRATQDTPRTPAPGHNEGAPPA